MVNRRRAGNEHDGDGDDDRRPKMKFSSSMRNSWSHTWICIPAGWAGLSMQWHRWRFSALLHQPEASGINVCNPSNDNLRPHTETFACERAQSPVAPETTHDHAGIESPRNRGVADGGPRYRITSGDFMQLLTLRSRSGTGRRVWGARIM